MKEKYDLSTAYFISEYNEERFKPEDKAIYDQSHYLGGMDLCDADYSWDLVDYWYFPSISKTSLYSYSGSGCSCNSAYDEVEFDGFDYTFSECKNVEEAITALPEWVTDETCAIEYRLDSFVKEKREEVKELVEQLEEFYNDN